MSGEGRGQRWLATEEEGILCAEDLNSCKVTEGLRMVINSIKGTMDRIPSKNWAGTVIQPLYPQLQ